MKYTYILTQASVMFAVFGEDKTKPVNGGTMPVNTVLRSEEKYVNALLLGQIRSQTQVAFRKELAKNNPDELLNTEIIDVIINNIMVLGYMTEEEWLKGINQKSAEPEEDEDTATNG